MGNSKIFEIGLNDMSKVYTLIGYVNLNPFISTDDNVQENRRINFERKENEDQATALSKYDFQLF